MKKLGNKGIVVCDIDGTITKEDTLFAFFEEFGKLEQAKELDLEEPSSDVKKILDELAAKKPIPIEKFYRIGKSAKLRKGAKNFFSKLRDSGFGIALVSATYEPIALKIAERACEKKAIVKATKVVTKEGFVEGFEGPLMEGPEKTKAIERISRGLGSPLSKFVGIGDGALDAPFIRRIVEAGGLGIAVSRIPGLLKSAKPQVSMGEPNFRVMWKEIMKFRRRST